MLLGRGGTMFGGQGEQGTFAAHIEIGVAPAMKFTGTAQGLTWTAGVGVFAGVMNEHDRQVKLALEFAQKGEQRADLRGVVFGGRCSRPPAGRAARSRSNAAAWICP